MTPRLDDIKDKTWFNTAWKHMSDTVDEKTVNHAHLEVRSAVMNHALSRAISHACDKLK